MKSKNNQLEAEKEAEKTPENILRQKHYRDLRKKHIIRLIFTYLAPLILLIIYFEFQYSNLLSERQYLYMNSIAKNQSNMLDLFIRERTQNLINLIDDPQMKFPPSMKMMQSSLAKLKRDSDAFIDLGFFDSSGVQTAYTGPLSFLEKRDYGNESWYISLQEGNGRFIVTDIYLGLRKKPHFTIGVKRLIDNQAYVLKASLDPQKIYEYMTSIEKTSDLYISIVNRSGTYQCVPDELGKPLDTFAIVPPYQSDIGFEEVDIDGSSIYYAYSWLAGTDWAVIVHTKKSGDKGLFSDVDFNIIAASSLIIIILLLVIFTRSKKMVELEQEKDIVKTQLEQSSKLATVGELASGIAHEIGNPLTIIANEVGIMEDYTNPRFRIKKNIEDLKPNFAKINKAVFRCRDITKKLLTFVRTSDFELKRHNLNEIIDDQIEGFFEHEMAVSNIEIVRDYADTLPPVIIDSNQFRQVLVNLLNNAADAITAPGKITISTRYNNDNITVSVTDTGKGISQEQIDKIFLPFYTTKPVGKGTGLGLSVSYGIIKNLGGKIKVESIPGKGSSFIITLPV